MDEIYQDRILEHFEEPFHRGRSMPATHAHAESNPLCGDAIEVTLEIDEQGCVRQAYFDGHGCCISQASASMLLQALEGKTLDEVRAFSAADMLQLFGARLTPNRQKCCLLGWRVLQQALHAPLDPTKQLQPLALV